jgi:hypothetical protein
MALIVGSGEGDSHLDLFLVDAGERGGVHLHVFGCLGPHPHLEDAVLAHPARRVVRLHRRVREVRQRVRRVDCEGRVGHRPVNVALVPRGHGLLAGLDEAHLLG